MKFLGIAMAALSLIGCATIYEDDSADSAAFAPLPDRVFIIGQDLDALRGYHASGCCIRADGTTAYLSLYRLRDDSDFGGLGYDLNGRTVRPEASWGSGPVGARQSVSEFDVDHLAIGLFIAENDNPGGLQQIAEGKFDPEIERLAAFIKTVPGQVFLRIGYEFDGTWNHGQGDHAKYIAAFRHIVDQLRAQDVANALYVWHGSASIADDLIEQRHEDITNWYPGSDYVDWMGVSWFSVPTEPASVDGAFDAKLPLELANEILDFARAEGKPLLIAEAAPQGFDLANGFRANVTPIYDGPSRENIRQLTSEEIWDVWYAPLFRWMNENADTVRGLAYINVNWDVQPMWGPPYDGGFWGDTRLETDPEIAARFNDAVESWRAGN
ncbi:MAG: glycosyl hydrolase [Pseudomonadota bacterium]|nr:glycosyl hydrolase [Pseudomonadota bacterium]